VSGFLNEALEGRPKVASLRCSHSATLDGAFIAAVLSSALATSVRADINPWIAAELCDPGKWDTAGPQTASPWLHPPTWTPGQEWGVFSGRVGDATALTGGWGGTRDRLVEKGVSLVGAYSGQPAANPVGGERQGSTWLNDVNLEAFFDMERLTDWKGGFLMTSVGWKSGNSVGLTPEDIRNEFPVQLSTGDNAIRMVNLALGQQFLDNKAELAAGRLITGEDFATIRLACTSFNQAICGNPIAANRSISWPTYPSAVWGARFKAKPGTSWYAQTGAYLVYPCFRDLSFLKIQSCRISSHSLSSL
jgi:hypothetical protein